MIVKMNSLRLLGSSDDKEKIGVARPEWPPLRGFQGTRIEEAVKKSKSKKSRQRKFYTPVKPTLKKLHMSVH